MKKDLGVVPAVYPMPVLMVAAYDEQEKVNVMNVAWGQICDMDKIILFIGEGKKTWLNIKASGAFTVALADRAHMDVADFFGIASGNGSDYVAVGDGLGHLLGEELDSGSREPHGVDETSLHLGETGVRMPGLGFGTDGFGHHCPGAGLQHPDHGCAGFVHDAGGDHSGGLQVHLSDCG